ncbi:MAG: DUF2600 family protein [Solirubrobacteraceae bacterium]
MASAPVIAPDDVPLDAEARVSALGDRRLVARAGVALLVANLRYWSTVAGTLRGELRRWERRAQAIEDPELRALALQKLHREGFHAEAAGMLATLAPRAHRRDAVRAIVALELLYDYLDGLTERPSEDPLRDGERLFDAYVKALSGGEPGSRLGGDTRDGGDARGDGRRRAVDGGYLDALSDAVNDALTRLPAAGAITGVARASAIRSAAAQTRMHAACRLGIAQVEEWARGEVDGTELPWQELLAGAASSVLAVHALIAAAADPATTHADAVEIERAYLCTCVLLTLLDGLVDDREDRRSGHADLGYVSFFADRDELAQTLTAIARRASVQARALRNGPHHVMILVGVVAYYTSAPGAKSELARPVAERLQRELAPLIFPTLALMRGWRLAKRARTRRPRSSGDITSSMGNPTGAEVQ